MARPRCRGRDRLTSGVWERALKQGDDLATRLIDRAVKALGAGVASCVNVIDPEAVIIGGGLGVRFGEKYVRRIAARMHPHLFVDERPPAIRLAGLDELGEARIEVLHHDVLADDFPPDSFDLVHCRAVLVHLDDPQRALERMTAWLRPGGPLVAEEPWTDVARLAPDPVVARSAGALADIDGAFARRLPQALRSAGLERVEAEARLEFFEGGSR